MRSRPSSRATTTFCWLPPDSVPAVTSTDGVRMSNSVTHACDLSRIASSSRTSPRAYGGAVVVVQDDVVGDREGQHHPEPMPVGGDEADALRMQLPGRCGRDVPARQGHAAGSGAAQARDRLDELVLAVAGHAGDPEDLAGTDVEAHAVDDLAPAIVGDLEALGDQHHVGRGGSRHDRR